MNMISAISHRGCDARVEDLRAEFGPILADRIIEAEATLPRRLRPLIFPCSARLFERGFCLFQSGKFALPEQVDTFPFAIDEAHSDVPPAVDRAQNRYPRDILGQLVVKGIRDMLSEIALSQAPLPKEVERLRLNYPLRQNGSELRTESLHKGIASPV